MVENQHRHRVETEPAGGIRRPWPAMTVPSPDDQDRIGPAELDDAGGDLRHLLVGVRARIARVGAQAVERPVLDRVGQPGRHGSVLTGLVGGGNRARRLPRGVTTRHGVKSQPLRACGAHKGQCRGGNW